MIAIAAVLKKMRGKFSWSHASEKFVGLGANVHAFVSVRQEPCHVMRPAAAFAGSTNLLSVRPFVTSARSFVVPSGIGTWKTSYDLPSYSNVCGSAGQIGESTFASWSGLLNETVRERTRGDRKPARMITVTAVTMTDGRTVLRQRTADQRDRAGATGAADAELATTPIAGYRSPA